MFKFITLISDQSRLKGITWECILKSVSKDAQRVHSCVTKVDMFTLLANCCVCIYIYIYKNEKKKKVCPPI